MSLHIIIADDHPSLIEGVATVLKEIPDVIVHEPCFNGRALIDRLRRNTVDIVLLDLNMPKMDGISALKILKEEFPQVKIIVFTSYDQPKFIREIKELGAAGYLPKTSASVLIKEAIISVAAGKTWFNDEPAHHKASQYDDDFTKKYQLTKREIEIIRMIGCGMSTLAISQKLSLSEFTVNTHRRNIGRKLNIHTPVGLLNFAKEQGLI